MVSLEGNTTHLVFAVLFLGFSVLFISLPVLRLIRRTEELIEELRSLPKVKEEEVREEVGKMGPGAVLVLALILFFYFLVVAILLYLMKPVGW